MFSLLQSSTEPSEKMTIICTIRPGASRAYSLRVYLKIQCQFRLGRLLHPYCTGAPKKAYGSFTRNPQITLYCRLQKAGIALGGHWLLDTLPDVQMMPPVRGWAKPVLALSVSRVRIAGYTITRPCPSPQRNGPSNPVLTIGLGSEPTDLVLRFEISVLRRRLWNPLSCR